MGEAVITVPEFLSSYEAGPSILKDLKRPKRSFLDAMIHEELLAGMLKQDSSYSQYPPTQKALRLLKQELLVERMFKEEVHDKVVVSDEEIKTAIIQSDVSVKAKYLVTHDRKLAEQCLARLDAGVDFDDLLSGSKDLNQTAFLDSTDFIKYGELESPLNEILFGLDLLAYSDVIPVGDSFIILQNVNMLRELASEGDLVKYHDRFNKILMYQKRLADSRRFIKEFMDPLEIQVAGESFVFLVNALYDLYVNVPYEQGLALENKTENPELSFQKVVDQIQDHADDPAVRFNGGALTIQELLDQLLLKPFHIESVDKQAFAKELNAEIAIALRDYFLEQEALARGYDKDIKIVNELERWSEKLMVQDYIGELRHQIIIPETEVKRHLGNTNEVGDARFKQVEQELINLQCKHVLDQQVDSLLTLTKVTIDDAKLAAINVELPGEKQSPDTYLFKLGLPYLRSAFPTPDPIWGKD